VSGEPGARGTGLPRVPTGLEDVSKYVELFSALYGSGQWTVLELKKLAGLNFLRVWREVEKVGIGGKQRWK
jgi:membrane dipeptidase